jgi:hypothetical protein
MTLLPMSAPLVHTRPVDRSLEGGRILYRHFLSNRPASEGWVREFNENGSLVRISRTNKATDAGLWHRAHELRLEGVLEPAKAPAVRERLGADLGSYSDESGELGLS